ncbi:MAG: hypothetical protein LUH82_07525 [Clostridiales bacterium]|nr:hypothetical protein [Clostridiales bacterium]
MNKLSKYIAALLTAILIISNSTLVYASNEIENNSEVVGISVKSDAFEQLDMESCNYIDVIEIDTIDNDNFDTVKELLDNGTSIYVTDDDPIDLIDFFDEEISEFDEADVYLGTYIQSYGDDYMVTPVVADIVDLQESEIEEDELDDILDISDVYNDIQNDISDIEFFESLSDEQKAKLQTSTAIGSSFKDASLFKYFYKKGTAGGTGTTYTYSGATSKSGWSKLGSIKILGYAIKIKTVGAKTYDDIYSVVTASGLNDKYVKYYTYNMQVTSSNTSIIDESFLIGDTESKVTTSIGTSVSSDGTSTITSTTSYSYSPNGQTISNQLGEKYVKTWTATPNSKAKNGSWKIYPSIMVVNSSGKTTNTTVKLYVSSFRVRDVARTYTINDSTSVTLSFKNHS